METKTETPKKSAKPFRANPVQRQAMVELARRKLCERSLHDFVLEAWSQVEPGRVFKDNWHIKAECAHLEAVTEKKIKRIIFNVPPGTMKSVLVCVMWPAWVWTTKPERRFMFATYSDFLSSRDSVRCRQLVTSHWYQSRWPLLLTDDQNTKGKWVNQAGGWRMATSVGGKATGEHPDYKCLHPKAKVLTSRGWIEARHLNKHEVVLSYNHHRKAKEWQHAKVTSGKAKPCVEIITSSGFVLKCTSDHPVFVIGRGYVAAATLQPGERVIAYDREVPNLRQGILQMSGTCQTRKVAFLLTSLSRKEHDRIKSPKVHRNQSDSMQAMREAIHCPGLRLEKEKAKVLFCYMQGERDGEESAGKEMSPMWCGVQVEAVQKCAKDFLFGGMFIKGASDAYSRKAKWPMDSRAEPKAIQSRIHKGEGAGEKTGREQMHCLWGVQRELRQGNGHSSCGLQQGKQFCLESGYMLSVLPREDARWKSESNGVEAETIASVKKIETPKRVITIGVEENHNFFAGGILTHNCFDDPHNVKGAESEAERQSVIDWWDGTMENRGAMLDSCAIGIMQRLHTNDLSGYLLDKGNWEHVCLPMRFETGRMKTTSIGFNDPRTTEGELLWPEVYPEEKVAELETNMGFYFTSGQMQQRPTPRGGGMFERNWFFILQHCPKLGRKVRYWDKAGSQIGTGAESAGVLLAEYEDESVTGVMRKKYIVLDVITFRKRAAEREAVMKQTAEMDRSAYGYVETWVEQEPGSGGKESAENTVANLSGFSVQIERVTGSKETRAEPLSGQAKIGRVGILAAPWNRHFLDEIENFPLGKLKDIVDATSGAFNKLHQPTGAWDARALAAATSGQMSESVEYDPMQDTDPVEL